MAVINDAVYPILWEFSNFLVFYFHYFFLQILKKKKKEEKKIHLYPSIFLML